MSQSYYTLQTNPWPLHREEEAQDTDSQMTLKCIKVRQKALSTPAEIAKQETTLCNAQHNNDQT